MFDRNVIQCTKSMLLAGVLASSLLSFRRLIAQSPAPTAAAKPAAAPSSYRVQPNRFARQAERYYGYLWGVDELTVKYTESGEMIRFSYRVIDAEKAEVLNDKKLGAVP